MNLIKLRIKEIMSALPQESTSTNIMRHILKVIREEYESLSKVSNKYFYEDKTELNILFRAKLKDSLYMNLY